MSNWKSVFEVLDEYDLSHSNYKDKEDLIKKHMHLTSSCVFVMYKQTGQVAGIYRDFRYAVKQARFRYKKMERKIERLLLR